MAKLPPDRHAEAYRRIRAAQDRGETAIACPVCDKPGMPFVDQSARPVTEWYAMSCPACGLAATVGVAMRGH